MVTVDENSEESEDLVAIIERALVGKLITGKIVNMRGPRSSLLQIWRLNGDLLVKDMGESRLLFQFSLKDDKTRVLDGRPWSFDNHLLLIEQLQKEQQISEVDFSSSHFWIHIRDVPMSMRTHSCARRIRENLGEFMSIDDSGPLFLEEAMCVKVRISILKPLRRGLRIELKSGVRKWVCLQYERLPIFCYYCGVLAHAEASCEVQIADGFQDSSLPYDPWMKAPSKPRRSGHEQFSKSFFSKIHDDTKFGMPRGDKGRSFPNWDKVSNWLNLKEDRIKGISKVSQDLVTTLAPTRSYNETLKDSRPGVTTAQNTLLEIPADTVDLSTKQGSTTEPTSRQGNTDTSTDHTMKNSGLMLLETKDHSTVGRTRKRRRDVIMRDEDLLENIGTTKKGKQSIDGQGTPLGQVAMIDDLSHCEQQ